jgi:hypothetical protein
LKIADGIDGDSVPSQVSLQIIGRAVDLVMVRPDIDEDPIPLVLEKIPDDQFLIVLGKVFGSMFFYEPIWLSNADRPGRVLSVLDIEKDEQSDRDQKQDQ